MPTKSKKQSKKIAFASDGTMQMESSKIKTLNKAGLLDKVDLCYETPTKYYNFETKILLCPEEDGQFICVTGELVSVVLEAGAYHQPSMVKARVKCKEKTGNDTTLYVSYFGLPQMEQALKPLVNQEVIVCGRMNYKYGKYLLSSPQLFDSATRIKRKWDMVYKKHHGISEMAMKNYIDTALKEEPLKEFIPEDIREKLKIPERKKSLLSLHAPMKKADIQNGLRRLLIEDLLYFAAMMHIQDVVTEKKSPFVVFNTSSVDAMIADLPYRLTKDQQRVFYDCLSDMTNGVRVNCLVQGDVGCGKSIVAFLLMLAMADNGFQSALMAPTVVLAKQHYDELSSYASKYGYKVAFLGGTQTPKQVEKIRQGIKDGDYDMIVGTHAAVSASVEYKNLGLAIVDEEHRFGVKEREGLAKKAEAGVHEINFSATPIPRSMASTIYGTKKIQEIKEMPQGRKPVKTFVECDENKVIDFVKRQVANGDQAYVVCPLIDSDDETTTKTVSQTAELYSKQIGVEVGVVTGKQKKAEVEDTLYRFKNGEIKILIATTVIEVGVNVPNATVIVIEDAYLFGLAQLHQLRGRVGRGNKQGYCILCSDRDSDRLNVMVNTNDGFIVAEKDLALRGAGNLIGLEQSGNNRYFMRAISYPMLYRVAKECVEVMYNRGELDLLIEEMGKRSEKIFPNPKKIKLFESVQL